MEARDIYIKHTDKEGKSHIQEHRVWDASLFFDSLSKDAAKHGGTIELSTYDDYKATKKR